MDCPFCEGETKVLESRLVEDAVRRRRECLRCAQRFTTYEEAFFQLTVLKKDGRIQPFDAEKITRSVAKACVKADPETVLSLGKRVEQKLLAQGKKQFSTKEIGRRVLQELRKHDKMAYVRFASIHKEIEDPQLLKKEVSMIA